MSVLCRQKNNYQAIDFNFVDVMRFISDRIKFNIGTLRKFFVGSNISLMDLWIVVLSQQRWQTRQRIQYCQTSKVRKIKILNCLHAVTVRYLLKIQEVGICFRLQSGWLNLHLKGLYYKVSRTSILCTQNASLSILREWGKFVMGTCFILCWFSSQGKGLWITALSGSL